MPALVWGMGMPDRRSSNGILATAAIDYITATGEIISGENSLLEFGAILERVARKDGNIRRPWGFHGYIGTACGEVSVGTRDDSAILRVSGHRAASVGRTIIDLADNVSRIDIQCTILFSRDRAALDREHEAEFRRYKRRGGLTRTARSIDGLGRGNSLVIGSRASNYHGRIYDKWRESGDEQYRYCWRYEVECKGDGAREAARLVKDSEEMETAIARSVRRWFVERGIDPRFSAEPSQRFTTVARPLSDAEESLRYLYKQVTPLVMRLREWYSEEELAELIFGRLTPDEVVMASKEAEIERSLYEEWVIASERQRRTLAR